MVERAKHDGKAFCELYRHYYRPIFRYVLRRTGNLQTAEDVTADTFLRSLENIGKFQWRGVPFGAWLYRIASREIASSFRRDHRNRTPSLKLSYRDSDDDPSELSRAQDEFRKYEEFLALHDCILRLPLIYQEVITLRYFEQLSMSEIGQIVGKPDGTVKSLLHRGLKRLRVIMY